MSFVFPYQKTSLSGTKVKGGLEGGLKGGLKESLSGDLRGGPLAA